MPPDDKLARKVAKKQLLEEEKHCQRKKQISWNKNITEYPSSEEYEEENHKHSNENNDNEDDDDEEKNI